ncbi:uroporphyrinogen-III synthase [Streptomyces sp. J2-1]|uniref:uroporphyrinogen-III synthase n=1 Tax=Streptomyces corallincola TaxID=2851888 RepID=UPI001C383096|nr:uroporphyrinogen-III synthase [Streptomyces corallincola]MBV2354353.1 uroporphyrinogen-III synthase [Streptomyces corallincola]
MHDAQHHPAPGGPVVARESAAAAEPLAGFTVGITAARRADELAGLLGRRGAAVVHAPALRTVPVADDGQLRAATEEIVAKAPDIVVATTAIGFRGWLEAAESWGLGAELLDRLRAAEILTRGPKVKGAVRGAGLTETWSPEGESLAEVLQRLLDQELAGRRIAVQQHGEPLTEFVDALRARGADVVPLAVYRWLPPADPGPLDRLLDSLLVRGVDAVAFTSAPAALSLLDRAGRRGQLGAVVEALSTGVLAACVGPVTAAPLRAHGVEVVQPERFRLGPLVQTLCRELPARARSFEVAGRRVELRGHAVLLDGAPRAVPPAGMALLRALALHPGRVVSRADLLRALPGGGRDEHAVESAMARLRTALGEPELIRTVVKRGYRLAAEPVEPTELAEPHGTR